MTTDPTDLAATIAEGVPYHVWVVRADGSIEYNNRQFLDYTGLSEDQALVDAHRSELVHPDDRDALVVASPNVRRTLEIVGFSTSFRIVTNRAELG